MSITETPLCRSIEELTALNALSLWSIVLVGSTSYRIAQIYPNSVHESDTSWWTTGIRARYRAIMASQDWVLRYNSWGLSKISGDDERDAITTNAISVDPNFKVTIPE